MRNLFCYRVWVKHSDTHFNLHLSKKRFILFQACIKNLIVTAPSSIMSSVIRCWIYKVAQMFRKFA